MRVWAENERVGNYIELRSPEIKDLSLYLIVPLRDSKVEKRKRKISRQRATQEKRECWRDHPYESTSFPL